MSRSTRITGNLVSYKGLSPSMAALSRAFYYRNTRFRASPRSLATTYGISVDFFSFGYLDVSVPRVLLFAPIYSGRNDLAAGFPHSDIFGSTLFANSPKLFAG